MKQNRIHLQMLYRSDCMFDFCTMEMRLKEAWKPLLNMLPTLKGSLKCSVQGKQATNLYMHLKLIRPFL